MASSLKRLITLNDQGSLLSGIRNFNPFFRFSNWQAQRLICSIAGLKSRTLDKSIKTQVDAHRKETSDTQWKSGSGDILDLALHDAEYGKLATTSEIIDQMKSFFFAGNDTTSAVLSWAYVYLDRNPTCLTTLRKELDDVFGIDTSAQEVANQILENPKILNRLEYTLAVAKETLRLEPPAQMIRTTTKPHWIITRSGKRYMVEKDTAVLINLYQMARNPQIWGKDASEFKPERFLNGSTPSAFMSFSKRPRDCIGTNLAYLEVWPYRKLS